MSTVQPHVVADRYRLVQQLGQGGMGRVWLAHDDLLHRDVAIKEIVPPAGLTSAEREEMRERSLREARAIARLSHPNVVRVFDVLSTNGEPWIVMEYVASRSLQEVLATDGPLPPARVADIGLGVLAALRAAHRSGVLHRDVKPGNVLLGENGRTVLTDFGLATVPGDPSVTRTGLVLGSPAYLAPERARDGTAGPEADIWSLGATLYAAVEGQSPYARPSAIATLSALATEPPAPAKQAGALRPALNGMLRKNPNDRISAAEVERLLLRAAGPRSRTSMGRALFPAVRLRRPPDAAAFTGFAQAGRGPAGTGGTAGPGGSSDSAKGTARPVVPGQSTGSRSPSGSVAPAASAAAPSSPMTPAAPTAKAAVPVTRPGTVPSAPASATLPSGPAAKPATPPALPPPTPAAKPAGPAAEPATPPSAPTATPATAPSAPAATPATQPTPPAAWPAVQRAESSDPVVKAESSGPQVKAEPGTQPALPAAALAASAEASPSTDADAGTARKTNAEPQPGSTLLAEPQSTGTPGERVVGGQGDQAEPQSTGMPGERVAGDQTTQGRAGAPAADVMSDQATGEDGSEPGTEQDRPATFKQTAGRWTIARSADKSATGSADKSSTLDDLLAPDTAKQPTVADESLDSSFVPIVPDPRFPRTRSLAMAASAPVAVPPMRHPPTEEAAPAGGAGVPRAWWWGAAAVAGVLVIVLIAAAISAAGGGTDTKRGGTGGGQTAAPPAGKAGTPSAATSSKAAASPTVGAASASAGAGGVALPAGWEMYTDRTGFSVAVPSGWRVSRVDTMVYFREPGGGGRVLGIDQSNQPKSDPVADWTDQEARRKSAGDWADYSRVKIVAVNYFLKAADWEFTYAASGGRLHVVNRGFVTSSTQAYAIYWSTSDADWQANQANFNLIASSFQPRR
jgi:serine/threonine protein kinase